MLLMINNGINTLNLVCNEQNDKGNQQTYCLHLIMIWSMLLGMVGYTIYLIVVRISGLINNKNIHKQDQGKAYWSANLYQVTCIFVGTFILIFMFWQYSKMIKKEKEDNMRDTVESQSASNARLDTLSPISQNNNGTFSHLELSPE